ncbi:MAG: diguanylate cyclase [Litoreibacter sp.]
MIGHILIIEPLATNRIIIKARLTASHYEVTACEALETALEAVSQGLPDLIIINRSLGLADLKRLRATLIARGNCSLPPIIAIGAPLDNLPMEALFSHGADSYMEWPIPAELMCAKVRSLTRRTQKLHGLEERCTNVRDLDPLTNLIKSVSPVIVARTLKKAGEWAQNVGEFLNTPFQTMTFVDAMETQHPHGTPPTYLLLTDESEEPENILHTLATLKAKPENNAAHFMIMFPEGAELEAAAALDMGADTIAWTSDTPRNLAAHFENMCTYHTRFTALETVLDDGLKLAVTDPLTGLHNRRFCDVALARICSEAKMNKKQIALMIVDIDHFKHINDQHGHAGGDYILAHVATTLRAHLRERDLIARIGGEEFLVALPHTRSKAAISTANRLRHAIETMDLTTSTGALSGQARVTVSIGIAMSDETYKPSELTCEADRALYVAKSTGRNKACIARPAHLISPEARASDVQKPVQGAPQTPHVTLAS